MNDITLRPAILKDASFLPDLEKSAGEAFRSVPGLEWIADDEVMSADLHETYIDEGTVWVAESSDQLVGFITTRLESDEKSLHIIELSVESGQQGKGIGRKLMNAAMEFASKQSLRALTLTTFRDLAFNEKFYQKLGFQTLDPDKISPRLHEILIGEAESEIPAERRCAMLMQL